MRYVIMHDHDGVQGKDWHSATDALKYNAKRSVIVADADSAEAAIARFEEESGTLVAWTEFTTPEDADVMLRCVPLSRERRAFRDYMGFDTFGDSEERDFEESFAWVYEGRNQLEAIGEYLQETSPDIMSEVPDFLWFYVDFERLAYDWLAGGDGFAISLVDFGGEPNEYAIFTAT